MRKVPGRFLHGYEAAYQVEKQKSKEGKSQTGIFVGLQLLFPRYPDVLGMFCMVYFYEVIAAVLSFLRLRLLQKRTIRVYCGSEQLFVSIYFYDALSRVLFSLIGTRTLMSWLGERVCLMLVPLIVGGLLLFLCLL